MSCIHCEPSKSKLTETPFISVTKLSDEIHEGVELGACSHCGQDCLLYWVDIYDDHWQFWCVINETEKNQLLSPDDGDEKQLHDWARGIIKTHVVLERHPVHGLAWVQGNTCLLQGAPW